MCSLTTECVPSSNSALDGDLVMELNAVVGLGERVSAHAGIVDQDVERDARGRDAPRKGTHRLEAREVQVLDPYPARLRALASHLSRSAFATCGVSAGD